MNIPSWLLKPIIREAVKTAMKEIFDKYATKLAALLTLVINGVCVIVGVTAEALEGFNKLALMVMGILAARSVGNNWAEAAKTKNGHTSTP